MSGRGLLALTSPVAGADPSRIPYEDIHSRYAPLMPDFVKELGAMLNGPDKELKPSQARPPFAGSWVRKRRRLRRGRR